MTEQDNQNQKPTKTFAEAQRQVRNKLKEAALNEFNKKVQEFEKERKEASKLLAKLNEREAELATEYAAIQEEYK